MRRLKKKIHLLLALLLVAGCTTTRRFSAKSDKGSPECYAFAANLDSEDRLAMLDGIGKLFTMNCYNQVIDLGMAAREEYSHKYHSVRDEVADIFTGEGTVSEYVMESYERAYLTYLVAMSFQGSGDPVGKRVELNRIYSEATANIYNFGEDPVNTVLQAALWEREPAISGFSARPFWKKLLTLPGVDDAHRAFAERRLAEIDEKKEVDNRAWQIAPVGRFPELDWRLKVTGSKTGYFSIKPAQLFAKSCKSQTGLFISTKSWLGKIAMRHSESYHPLVNAKTWIRLPIGLSYGIVTAAAGAGVAVGGCVAGGMIVTRVREVGEFVCQVSLAGAKFMMHSAADVTNYVLKPDMRHWQNVPAGFVITRRKHVASEPCYPKNADKAVAMLGE